MDVFISYSRHDRDFVHSLHDRLAAEQRDVWVDWDDIPPSAEWRAEIERGIEGADTFVCVLSPDAVASEMCRYEMEYAARSHKRIVPVVCRDVDAARVPPDIARLNFLFFRDRDPFDAAYRQLVQAMETDLEWVRAHSRLLVRAREWESHERDGSYLMAGSDLDEYERWLTDAVGRQPAPSDLQLAFLAAGRQQEKQRQRNQLRGFYLVSLVYGLVQTGISYFVAFDEISEEGLVALAPLWVLGVVFGVFGLTLGRTSLRSSVIATALAGVALFVFFQTLWGVL